MACIPLTLLLLVSSSLALSHFEEHMAKRLGIRETSALHRAIHVAASKVQQEVEDFARSGAGTSEYLAWKLGSLTQHEGRSLAQASGTTSVSAISPPPLTNPPFVPPINASLARWVSITPPNLVDWRVAVNTGIMDQKAVSSLP
jgi:hypothetical protein